MASIGYAESDTATGEQAALSGWWRRVGAALVDGLVVGIPLMVLFALLLGGVGEGGFVAGLIVSLAVSLIYAPLLMARGGERNGQTYGKQATGIRVAREDGQPMDFGKGFMRDGIGKGLLGLVPLYFFVDSLFPLGDGRNQAIHDKLGSTTVHRA